MQPTPKTSTTHAVATILPLLSALERNVEALRAVIAGAVAANDPQDALVAIGECGLERGTVRRFAARLGVVRIGRRAYVRRSAVLALADELAATPRARKTRASKTDVHADYVKIVMGGRT